MKKQKNTTQQSLTLLRLDGYTAVVCELPCVGSRFLTRDLLGFADIIAFKPGVTGVKLVQTTVREHVGERITKIKGILLAKLWLEANNTIEVHGWYEEEGKLKLRLVNITLEDFR